MKNALIAIFLLPLSVGVGWDVGIRFLKLSMTEVHKVTPFEAQAYIDGSVAGVWSFVFAWSVGTFVHRVGFYVLQNFLEPYEPARVLPLLEKEEQPF